MTTNAMAAPSARTSVSYFAGLLLAALAATLYLVASTFLPQFVPLNSISRSWLSIPVSIPWAPLMAMLVYCLFGFGILSGRADPPPTSLLGTFTMIEGMFLLFPLSGRLLREHAIPILVELLLLSALWLVWSWARSKPSPLRCAIFTALFSLFFSCAMLGWQDTPYIQRGL